VGYAAFDLKGAVKQKEHWSILKFARVRITVPAGETIYIYVRIPKEHVWFIVEDRHGDIPYNVFKHGCIKDGVEAFPPTLIGADCIEIPYAIPYICKEYLYGTIVNTDTADHVFELSIFYAEVERSYYERLAADARFEEEVEKLIREEWNKLDDDEKRELVRRWMRYPEILAAVFRQAPVVARAEVGR